MKKINIALDGYSSCGKSTLAKDMAKELGYVYIDSGAMYRAVTLYALRNGVIVDSTLDREKLIKLLDDIEINFSYNPGAGESETILNGENVENEIRQMRVSESVSKVSLIKEVRTKLVKLQQKMGEDKGVVMDGRDIGTAVFPDAELKFFMTAEKEERVNRRYQELLKKGIKVTREQVRNNISDRDHQDTHREENPLRKADDAVLLDNTKLTQEEQFEKAINLAKEKMQE